MATFSPSDALRYIDVTVVSGDRLDVRHFHVTERMSALFEISPVVVSDNADIDFEAIAGQPMSLTLRQSAVGRGVRTWTGICCHVEQSAAEDIGVSTYKLLLVPALWLLTQRRNLRADLRARNGGALLQRPAIHGRRGRLQDRAQDLQRRRNGLWAL
jgi:type VI secretion system secreted protein VgrG